MTHKSTNYSYIFFGSFQHYSLIVLKRLLRTMNYELRTIITTPPTPSGRHLKLTPSAVATFAKEHSLPLLELDKLDQLVQLDQPDFIVVAGYGKLLPLAWLAWPKIMAINMHPSLLPKYRGRFPAEWAILRGEAETGVTLIKMSPQFDQGEILAQAKLPIAPTDTKDTLYTKLFTLGADLLVDTLPLVPLAPLTPLSDTKKYFYARQLTRADGFIPWEKFQPQLVTGHWSLVTSRMLRALHPWPGVWTTQPNGKRLKLIALTPEVMVQEEGKQPKPWQQ